MIVTDEMLIAYLGGKLSAPDRAAVEAAVASDPAVAERLRRHREVGAMIQNAITSGGRKARTAAGDKSVAPVVSLADARRTREPPPPPKPQVKAQAARKPLDPRVGLIGLGLVAGVLIGLFAPRPTNDLLDGTLQARGVLAATLEQGLTADQKAGAAVRLLGTYRSDEGVWCRAFTGESRISGIACRTGDGWRLMMTEFGAPARSPVKAAAVASLGLGAPVDAAAERKARSAAWR
jgi:anti-sigma factor RsiW